MASFGWSALNSLLGRGKQAKRWQPPEASWSRPFGLGWDKPYTVRYASNLDDGPNHGMPLGGFGAGCFGRAPDGNINLWHLDGGEHWFGVLPDCQFALFEGNGRGKRAHALAVKPGADASRPDAVTQVEETVEAHRQLLEAFEVSRHQIPAGQLVELPYEALIHQPLAALKRIYDELGLSSWSVAQGPVQARIAQARSYAADPVILPLAAEQRLHQLMEEA